MNAYQKQVILAAKGMLDYPYKLGGWGGPNNTPPYGIDCRGLVQRSYRLAGAWDAIGGYQMNVRNMVKWAKENGRFRGPEAKIGRAWPVFYAEKITGPEPGNPDHIRHVGLHLWPIGNKRYPKGLVLSAVNPHWDVRLHEVLMGDLNINNLEIHGSCQPDWALLEDTEPPMADPEPEI